MHSLHILVITVTILFAAAATAQQSSYMSENMPDDAAPPMIVLDLQNPDVQPERETAGLQIQVPAGNTEYRDDRRCMTFCSRWGEDCVIHHAGTDRTIRKCMRTCKSFSEECL